VACAGGGVGWRGVVGRVVGVDTNIEDEEGRRSELEEGAEWLSRERQLLLQGGKRMGQQGRVLLEGDKGRMGQGHAQGAHALIVCRVKVGLRAALTSGSTQSTMVLKNWGTVAGLQGSDFSTMSMLTSMLRSTSAPMCRRICTCGGRGSPCVSARAFGGRAQLTLRWGREGLTRAAVGEELRAPGSGRILTHDPNP